MVRGAAEESGRQRQEACWYRFCRQIFSEAKLGRVVEV